MSPPDTIHRVFQWRLPPHVLTDPVFVEEIREDITTYFEENAGSASSEAIVWDAFKAVIRGQCIARKAGVLRSIRDTLATLEGELKDLDAAFSSDPSLENAGALKTKLLAFNEEAEREVKFLGKQAEARRYGEGDRPSRTLARLITPRTHSNYIHTIYDTSGHLVTGQEAVLGAFADFYATLYTSRQPTAPPSLSDFLDSIALVWFNDNHRQYMDLSVTIQDIAQVIKSMPANKAPGPDGLTTSFYKTYVAELAPRLHSVFVEALESNSLPDSMREALIITLLKPDKDEQQLDSYRPLSLINVDAKIYAKVFFEKPESHHDAEHPPAAESLDIFEIISKGNEESKQLLHAGDIAVKPGRSAMVCKDNSCFWPKSSDGTVKVPYTLSGYSDSEATSITDAISEFTALTCIRFVDRTTETDYLQIAPGDGCWSFMGRTRGPQSVSLGVGCLSRGSIQHELNHALGFHHEQSRSDRDDYVKIMTEFISDGNLANFNKENTNNLGLEYDFSSIMHYGRYAFTKTSGQATIVSLKNPNAEMGQTVGLSNLDLAKINRLYNCDMCSTISRVGFGFLNSTNYPSQYPSNTDCSYLIRVNAAKILLTFNAFDIESSPNCESDYVRVYDGMTKDSPVLLNKACGRGSVPPVVSSTNVMLLQFVTNGAISASGFNAYYQNVVCAHAYSTSPGTVTSENYPQNYPASLDCGYYISAPSGNKISLTFTSFDLEPSVTTCRADYLVIYNGPTNKDPLIGRYCGSGPVPSVVSSGNSLLLQFHSDSSDQKKGFQATYTFV
ncbi:embryonic protein UVS.2-like [Lissotriton helveticus]